MIGWICLGIAVATAIYGAYLIGWQDGWESATFKREQPEDTQ